MNRVFVHGWGAVSPAGWGCASLLSALRAEVPLPTTSIQGPQLATFFGRRVPAPSPRPTWLAQPRLRRSSAITHFTVGAALEALAQSDAGSAGLVDRARLGVVCNVFGGSVIYSRRFFEEVLQNPEQASPLLFPETVFNAPASHLSAVIGSSAPNHTLVGDQTAFLQGLAVAADWLADSGLDACLVVGAEEWDWSTAAAASLFAGAGNAVLSEGAGALVLRRTPGPVELLAVSDPSPFIAGRQRSGATERVRSQLEPWRPGVEFDGSRAQFILGDSLAASGAWNCVAAAASAADASNGPKVAAVVITGANMQALGCVFAGAETA